MFCAMRFKRGLGLASCKKGRAAASVDMGGAVLDGIKLPAATSSDVKGMGMTSSAKDVTGDVVAVLDTGGNGMSLVGGAAGDHSRRPVVEGFRMGSALVPRSPSTSIACRPSAERVTGRDVLRERAARSSAAKDNISNVEMRIKELATYSIRCGEILCRYQ